MKMMNKFPLIELTEEALKENAVSLLGNEYTAHKEMQLLDCFFENERIITSWQASQNDEIAISILEKFDKILNTHGIESLTDANYSELEEEVYYCNTGDTYGQTIIWYDSVFHIGDWGSLYEWVESQYEDENDEEE